MIANRAVRNIQRGYGSAERPLARVLWDRDTRDANAAMREVGNYEPENEHVDYRRYYDPAFAQQELEKLWPKTWLFAAREEDIPAIGDRVPFAVGPLSFVIIRSGVDEFKAFYNSCIHRGTRLCNKAESGDVIKCPYHGWEWKVDGSLKFIPSHWDFKTVTPKNGHLNEVKLGRWDGFIFVNADPDAVPLAEALGVIPRHFAEYRMQDRYTAARYRKHVGANWKVAQEAFMESYHVVGTHPAAVPYNGDSQAQYDIWASKHSNIGRQIVPSAIPSMHAPPDATPMEAAIVYATIMKQWHYPDAVLPDLDPTQDLRAQLAAWHRGVQREVSGKNDDQPDSVMLDSTLYFMFPHSTFWLSESLPFTYQFTPHPTNPEQSYFDVRMLLPVPEGKPRPPSSPAIEVALDETIMDKAPAFGFLALVFDQDMANMPLVQAGMRAAPPSAHHSQLGLYQEMIVQHWNELIDRYLER